MSNCVVGVRIGKAGHPVEGISIKGLHYEIGGGRTESCIGLDLANTEGGDFSGNDFMFNGGAATSRAIKLTTCLGGFIGGNSVYGAGVITAAFTIGSSGVVDVEFGGGNCFLDLNGYAIEDNSGANAVWTNSISTNHFATPTSGIFSGNIRVYGSGAQQPQQFAGTGVPNNAMGNNGDVYYRQDGGAGSCIYQRRAGVWVATGA
jgi:hypothetical protein